MREIKYIVIHCSATTPKQNVTVDDIRQWHKDKGWSDIGYHYVIERNGAIQKGRPDNRAGAHVKGFNEDSLGICMVGGLNEEKDPDANFTGFQWDNLKTLIHSLLGAYPDAEVLGHRDFPNVSKACPCFDVKEWMKGTVSHF